MPDNEIVVYTPDKNCKWYTVRCFTGLPECKLKYKRRNLNKCKSCLFGKR